MKQSQYSKRVRPQGYYSLETIVAAREDYMTYCCSGMSTLSMCEIKMAHLRLYMLKDIVVSNSSNSSECLVIVPCIQSRRHRDAANPAGG